MSRTRAIASALGLLLVAGSADAGLRLQVEEGDLPAPCRDAAESADECAQSEVFEAFVRSLLDEGRSQLGRVQRMLREDASCQPPASELGFARDDGGDRLAIRIDEPVERTGGLAARVEAMLRVGGVEYCVEQSLEFGPMEIASRGSTDEAIRNLRDEDLGRIEQGVGGVLRELLEPHATELVAAFSVVDDPGDCAQWLSCRLGSDDETCSASFP